MSKRKSGLDVNGILLLDKRIGVSSNKALQEVRRLFNANKAGHTGSLDPLATGLLPLCFGKATKVSDLLLDHDKRYLVTAKLGVVTDTGDAEGVVLTIKPVPELTLSQLSACLLDFTGVLNQVPPMYSALKHQGKKLYELAREGKTVERQARTISIYELKLLGFEQNHLHLEVFCSKGTYIRSLVEDIGQALGCGATVTALRRMQVGQFDLKQAWQFESLSLLSKEALMQCLLPIDLPLHFMPAVNLSQQQADCVRQGQQIAVEGYALGMARVYAGESFLGLGEILLDGKLAPRKLMC